MASLENELQTLCKQQSLELSMFFMRQHSTGDIFIHIAGNVLKQIDTNRIETLMITGLYHEIVASTF